MAHLATSAVREPRRGLHDTGQDGPSKREKELVAKTKELEAKIAKKDHVIAEVTANEHNGHVPGDHRLLDEEKR